MRAREHTLTGMTTTRALHSKHTSRLITVPGLALAAALAVHVPRAVAHTAPITCGAVVKTDVRLTADLRDCPGSGLVVGAPGVTIDLAGHTIDGTGTGAGIDNEAGYDDIQVRGGTVREFLFGVHLFETAGARVEGLLVESNAGGVTVSRSQRVHIVGVTTGRNLANGIEITFSNRVTVRESTVANNGLWGIVDRYGANSRYVANTLTGNAASGLTVDSARRPVVERNQAIGNASDGISFERVENGAVTGNHTLGNQGNGIALDSPGNTLTRNVARYNEGFGIFAPAGTIDGGGNRASGNLGGDCTGVSCR